VVAVARRAERLEALHRADPRIEPHPADVARRADVAALAERVTEQFGRTDVLVNNAGVRGTVFRGPDDLDDVVRTMQINFMGTVHTMAAFRSLLAASAPSQVINVASVSGKVGTGPADYAASKFAVVGFSEALAMSWERDGITVTQLNPGVIRTEGFPQTSMVESRWGWLVGRPEMVADAVVDALARRSRERTVPRWYRPLVLLRHLVPPLYWRAAARVRRARGIR
jgi:hypothetical protein